MTEYETFWNDHFDHEEMSYQKEDSGKGCLYIVFFLMALSLFLIGLFS